MCIKIVDVHAVCYQIASNVHRLVITIPVLLWSLHKSESENFDLKALSKDSVPFYRTGLHCHSGLNHTDMRCFLLHLIYFQSTSWELLSPSNCGFRCDFCLLILRNVLLCVTVFVARRAIPQCNATYFVSLNCDLPRGNYAPTRFGVNFGQ